MLIIELVLYVWAFIRVSKGSGIKDVQKISLLMIISLIAQLLAVWLLSNVIHCQQYYDGFSGWYIDNINAQYYEIIDTCMHFKRSEAVRAILEGVQEVTIALAHWMFTYRYFMSALTLPSQFG
jgi:hypothetical protein